MGQHKFNHTALLAKFSKIPPNPKKMSKAEREKIVQRKIDEMVARGIMPGTPIFTRDVF